MKIATYTISAYEGDYYIFAIPLRTTKKWLQQALKRTEVINGEELTEDQFKILKPKIISGVECCWYPKIHYYLEGFNKNAYQSLERTPLGVPVCIGRPCMVSLSSRR